MTEKFSPEIRTLLAEVQVGIKAEDFLRSDVGRYLRGRARLEADEAMDRLKVHDATDEKGIRALQNAAGIADRLEQWLDEAINGGRNAEEQIKQLESNPGD